MADKIQQNIELASYTTYKIGGIADYFVIARSKRELIECLNFAKENNLPITVIGGGSNVLISDRGVRGLTIVNKANHYQIEGKRLRAESGSIFQKIARETIESGLTGLEFGANIPGTIGGAISGNAGAYGKSISDTFLEANCWDIEKGLVRRLEKDFDFMYRRSNIKNNHNVIVLDAIFELEEGNIDEMKDRLKKDSQKRSRDFRGLNCGCYFTNPVNVEILLNNKVVQNPSAGQLIDSVGLKNYSEGGAKVSNDHANVILNMGEATADDIIKLEKVIIDKVERKYGITLRTEVAKIGEF